MHIFKLKKNFHNFSINKKTNELFLKKLNKVKSFEDVFLLNNNLRHSTNVEFKKIKLADDRNSRRHFFLKKKIFLRKFFFLKKKSIFVRNFSSFFFFFNYYTKNLSNYKSAKLFLNKFKNNKNNKFNDKFKKMLIFIFKIHKFKSTEVNFFFKNFKEIEVKKKKKFKNKHEQKHKYKKNDNAFYHIFWPKNFRYKYQFSRFFKVKKKSRNKLKFFKLNKTNVNNKYLKSSLFLENNSDIQNTSFFLFKKNFYSFIDSVHFRKMFLFRNFYFFYLLNTTNRNKITFLFIDKNKNIILSFLKNYSLFITKKNINQSTFLNFFFLKNSYNNSNLFQNFFKLKTAVNEDKIIDSFGAVNEEYNYNGFFFNLLSFPNFYKIITDIDKFKKFDDFFFFYYKRSMGTFQSDDFFLYSNKTPDTDSKNVLSATNFFSKIASFSLFRLKNYNTFFKFFSFFSIKKKYIFLKKIQNFYYQTFNKKKKISNKKNFFLQNFSLTEITSSSKIYLNNQILNFNQLYSLNFADLVFFFNNPLFFKSYNFSKKNQFFRNTNYLSVYSSLLKKNINNNWTNLFIDPSIFSVDVARRVSFSSDYKKIKSFFAYLPYETLIKFIEYCSGKRAVVKIDPFLLKSIQTEDSARCYLWSHRIKFFRKNLGPRLFLVESLQILTLCLRLRDPYVLSNWMLSMFYKISFWKYKGLFRYLQYVLRYFFWPYFPDYKVKGLRFQLKGKVSVAGNARTRTVVSQIGALSHSTYKYKVLTNLNLLRTFTGVIGFKTWMVF